MSKIVTVFPNSDMRCSHLGLRLLASKAKKNTETLENGDFFLFLNRSQSAMKLFAANNTLIHYKSPRGRINIEAIRYIPECFNAGKFNFDKAVEKVLDKYLVKRGQ